MRGYGAVYFAIALSGFGGAGRGGGLDAAFGADVWRRTVYTFSIILAVFLVGLGLGSKSWVGGGPLDDAAAPGFWRMPVLLCRSRGVGRLDHYSLAAELAGQPARWL